MGRKPKSQIISETEAQNATPASVSPPEQLNNPPQNTMSNSLDLIPSFNETTIITTSNTAEAVKSLVNETVPAFTAEALIAHGDGPTPPIIFKRNKYGLLTHINYIFTEDGYVDWRAMVPKEFLYINTQYKDKLEKLYSKTLDEIDIVADNVEDKYLVVLLAGIKYIAKLRGFDRVTTNIETPTLDYVVARCTIDWISNYENVAYSKSDDKHDCHIFDTPSYTGIGSASKHTTNGFGSNYLAEIAENRAFCRAVRNFLNINIVSKEEISEKSPNQEDPQSIIATQKPTNEGDVSSVSLLVKSKILSKGKDFSFLKKRLEELGKDSPNYTSWNDLPPRLCFEILEMMANKENVKK